MITGCNSTGMNLTHSLNDKSHGYTTTADPISVKSKNVERFEIRHGDCGRNEDWSDCDNDRERSELTDRNRDPQNSYRLYS